MATLFWKNTYSFAAQYATPPPPAQAESPSRRNSAPPQFRTAQPAAANTERAEEGGTEGTGRGLRTGGPPSSLPHGRAEARPSPCALHGEGRASARPKGKWRVGQRLDRAWGVRKHSPLREGGAARWKDCQWNRAFGANGKGGGGSTAGCRICMASTLPIRKLLIHSFSVMSRAGRDGRAQYSPRRGPCRFPSSIHGHPIHGRATPLSEGGGSWYPP